MSLQVQITYFKMPTLGGGKKLTFNMASTYTRKIGIQQCKGRFLSRRKIGSVGCFLLWNSTGTSWISTMYYSPPKKSKNCMVFNSYNSLKLGHCPALNSLFPWPTLHQESGPMFNPNPAFLFVQKYKSAPRALQEESRLK